MYKKERCLSNGCDTQDPESCNIKSNIGHLSRNSVDICLERTPALDRIQSHCNSSNMNESEGAVLDDTNCLTVERLRDSCLSSLAQVLVQAVCHQLWSLRDTAVEFIGSLVAQFLGTGYFYL